MDTKLLIRQAHARFEFNTAKKLLKEKNDAKLIVADQGGLWKASIDLISFLSFQSNEKLILTDIYDVPLLVDRLQLLNRLSETYDQVMLSWYEEFETIKHNR